MGSAVLTNCLATTVSQGAPTVNQDTATGLGTRLGGIGDALAYIYFPRPFPLGATILSADLVTFSTSMPEVITHTFTYQRLNQSFSSSKVTWNTRPTSLIAGTKTVSKVGAVAIYTEWRLSITDWMQSVANGGVWYGIMFRTNEAVARWMYSEINASVNMRPRLEVTWSDAPATPTGLSPSGGRVVGVPKPTVRATYIDVSGAASLLAARVQLNTADVWNAVAPGPSFDTGIVLTSAPEVDLTLPFVHTLSATTTNTSTNITGAAGVFETADIGQPITGTGIQAATTITAVAAGGASATLSLAANASGTNTMTITRTWAGLADAATIFWRVQFEDASGLWSPWSASTTFKYDTKGVLTLTNPPSGTPKVEDATPPIIWTFTGEVQAAYQIQIRHSVSGGAQIVDWDSGKVTSTATTVTVPTGTITQTGVTYTVTVRIWDTEQREATATDNTYVEAVRDFTFIPGATTGTTGLTAVAGDPRPKVTLTWQRTTSPDFFNIVRNGKVIKAGLLPADLFVSGTTYTWVDNSPSPGRSLTYSVQAVVTPIASATNASAVVTVRSIGTWLRDPTSGLEVCITGRDERDFNLGEQAAVLQSIAPNATKVAINQGLGGLEGSIAGDLIDIHSQTAQYWRDQFLALRALRVRQLYLTDGDATILVVAQDFKYSQRRLPTPLFRVSFSFFQQDDVNLTVPLGS
jgi:hypothetical protein